MGQSCNKISYSDIPSQPNLITRLPSLRSRSPSRISLRRKRENASDEGDTRRCDDAWPSRGLPRRWLFARAKVCPPLGNNAGESLSLDGTPRRAEPKTARRWTEKEAGKGKRSPAEIPRREKDGMRDGWANRGREEWDAEEKERRDAGEESVYEIFPDAG